MVDERHVSVLDRSRYCNHGSPRHGDSRMVIAFSVKRFHRIRDDASGGGHFEVSDNDEPIILSARSRFGPFAIGEEDVAAKAFDAFNFNGEVRAGINREVVAAEQVTVVEELVGENAGDAFGVVAEVVFGATTRAETLSGVGNAGRWLTEGFDDISQGFGIFAEDGVDHNQKGRVADFAEFADYSLPARTDGAIPTAASVAVDRVEFIAKGFKRSPFYVEAITGFAVGLREVLEAAGSKVRLVQTAYRIGNDVRRRVDQRSSGGRVHGANDIRCGRTT